ncbi:MAG: hypothetical protein ACTSVZ_05810 [Promethearchaeota archaeon]
MKRLAIRRKKINYLFSFVCMVLIITTSSSLLKFSSSETQSNSEMAIYPNSNLETIKQNLSFSSNLALSTPIWITSNQTIQNSSILLQWYPVSGADEYNVYGGQSDIINMTVNTNEWLLWHGSPGETQWTLTAVSDGVESPRSNVLSIIQNNTSPPPFYEDFI